MYDLILPDIHTKFKKAEKIISRYSDCRNIYFLGDYFDDYNDTPFLNGDTATWLKWSLSQENRIHLLGNHCLNYYKPHLQKCSGFSWQKYETIRQILSEVDFEKLKTHQWINGYLLSHAGYSSNYTHPIKGLTQEVTSDWDKKMKDSLAANKLPELFWCGQDRYGNNAHSGPLWQDWWTFKKVEGVNQIVGHTFYQSFRESKGDYCLDTGLKCVGLLGETDLQVEYI